MAYTPRLKKKYRDDVVPALKKQFGYDNIMEVPRLAKISINKGVGEAAENQKVLDDAVDEISRITGQYPSVTRAKKSIANFNIREGMPIGVRVTLRDARMYEFMDRLVTLALPRERDFQGVPDRSFDGRGNYTLGIKEQIIFPEINVDRVDRISGMDATFVTTAETDEEALALLKALGMPFVRREDEAAAAQAEAQAEREKADREAAMREAKEEEDVFQQEEEAPAAGEGEAAEGDEAPDAEAAAAEAAAAEGEAGGADKKAEASS